MKKVLTAVLAITMSGCGGMRFAATEAQKQNAWVHQRTCQAAQQTARQEQASDTLTGLTTLAAGQSEAFVLDYGLPQEPPAMDTADAMLAGGPAVAKQAVEDARRKPDPWAMADGAMELGVGLAGLLGGVYGLRLTSFFKQARQKSQALKEIVEGNELFKQLCPGAAGDFKQAHTHQSAATRQLVTQVKTGG